MQIRDASMEDAASIQAIYAPFVSETSVSFEITPPDVAEMTRRIATISQDYPFLVAEQDGDILGYAYASQHRTRKAYDTSVDVAIYVAPHAHRRGAGRALMSALLEATAQRGYHAAFAGITQPNEASAALHEAMGFTPVGTYREVGRKFGRWIDVGWWQRLL